MRGQSTVEFAMMAVVLLGLLFGVIDLGRIGFAQHSLDGAATQLARTLATIANANSDGSGDGGYTPTPLNPTSGASAAPQIAAAVVAAAAQVGNGVSTAALAPSSGSFTTSTTTVSNQSITVVGTPNLTTPAQLTVTIRANLNTVTGLFLRGKAVHLAASSSAITAAGE